MSPLPDLRKTRETEFHDQLYGQETPRVDDAVYREDFVHYLRKRAFDYLGDLTGRRVLFYGCGVQLGLAARLYEAGAEVVMIDISSEAISRVRRRVQETGQGDRVRASVMDCEDLGFHDEAFDAVFGNAIIHHLDTERAVRELHRVMRRGGRAAFIEPLGSNPIINLYRWLTPGSRTADEHPLTARDWPAFKSRFSRFQHTSCTLLTLVPVAVNALAARVGLSYAVDTEVFRRVDEYVLERYRWLGPYCWNTVIHVEK